jgi:tripeptidyl-peptidase-1
LEFQCTGTAETVCSGAFGGVITSGGGFSDYYNRSEVAPWQETVVNKYLQASNSDAYPPLSYFNPNGRAYPDVSTYASNYFVYLNDRVTRESGTSASTPVFAAMVTLWNDIRLAYNLPPMGFIAPFLYDIYATNPEAFQDVVTGNNVIKLLLLSLLLLILLLIFLLKLFLKTLVGMCFVVNIFLQQHLVGTQQQD